MKAEDIVRSDFPTSRRGLDPGAVAEHLRAVAEHVEDLEDRAERAERGPLALQGIGGIARDRVVGILEAVERSTGEIETEARGEASAHVERVREDAERVSERIEALDAAVKELLASFREGFDRAIAELGAVEEQVGVLRSSATGESAGARAGVPAPAPDEPEPAPVPDEPEPEPVPVEPEPTPVPDEPEPEPVMDEPVSEPAPDEPESEPAPDGKGSADEEAARIVALNMALEGTPREEAVQQISEEFSLADPESLVDDVYSRAG